MEQKYARKPVAKPAVKKPVVIISEPYKVVPQPVVEQPVVKEAVIEPAVKEMKATFVTNFSNEFAHEVFKPLLADGEAHSPILFVKGDELPLLKSDKAERFIELARWCFIQWVGESK